MQLHCPIFEIGTFHMDVLKSQTTIGFIITLPQLTRMSSVWYVEISGTVSCHLKPELLYLQGVEKCHPFFQFSFSLRKEDFYVKT